MAPNLFEQIAAFLSRERLDQVLLGGEIRSRSA
jgi:hypothetical protein